MRPQTTLVNQLDFNKNNSNFEEELHKIIKFNEPKQTSIPPRQEETSQKPQLKGFKLQLVNPKEFVQKIEQGRISPKSPKHPFDKKIDRKKMISTAPSKEYLLQMQNTRSNSKKLKEITTRVNQRIKANSKNQSKIPSKERETLILPKIENSNWKNPKFQATNAINVKKKFPNELFNTERAKPQTKTKFGLFVPDYTKFEFTNVKLKKF